MTQPAVPVHDVAPFRARYRAAISPRYNAWLHGGFVLAWGVATLWFFWRQVADPSALAWLAVPAALLFCNWGEYRIHQRLGHTKTRLGKLFYQRHTGDHHSFFAEGNMHWESARDWRVILFPPWLIVVFTLLLALPAWWLLKPFSVNAAALFGGTVIAGYLLYETLHACEHLPEGHPLASWPWIRQMRRLHQLHHRRSLMAERNLNIVMPLMDWLCGTLHWEPHVDEAEAEQTVMTHVVEIRGTPEAVLAYAATPSHWPEWHPSSLRVQAAPGPQGPAAVFEEDIHAGGRPGHLSWRVTAYRPAMHWQAEARGPHRLWLRVDYRVEPCATGTRFERRLAYVLPGFVWGLYNRLIGRRRVGRESVESMARLKKAFEAREAD
jgi:hypothetical protein